MIKFQAIDNVTKSLITSKRSISGIVSEHIRKGMTQQIGWQPKNMEAENNYKILAYCNIKDKIGCELYVDDIFINNYQENKYYRIIEIRGGYGFNAHFEKITDIQEGEFRVFESLSDVQTSGWVSDINFKVGNYNLIDLDDLKSAHEILKMCNYFDKNYKKRIEFGKDLFSFYKEYQKQIHNKIAFDFFDKHAADENSYMNEVEFGFYDFKYYFIDITNILEDLNTDFLNNKNINYIDKLEINTKKYKYIFKNHNPCSKVF
jgi:hypothetical protein